jgi:predicted Rossmann fold nucleotide-binding protein DprA/Smf involved in DNA uptake
LAEEIYVAESNDKGGTWTGVMDGLKKGRTIYVRQPESDEKNANQLLIAKGAIAMDAEGNPLQATTTPPPSTAQDQMALFQ